jgi:hypothetical protein
MGFEPTIPALERAKVVHDLERAATVISRGLDWRLDLLTTLPHDSKVQVTTSAIANLHIL